MLTSRIACILDARSARLAHSRGQLWHDCYYPEILDEMGILCDVLSPEELPMRLGDYRVVLLTDFDASAIAGLEDWVRGGGTLLGFLTEGLDPLFGIRGEGRRAAADDEFTISAHLRLNGRGCLPYDEAYGDTIPILSPTRLIEADGGACEADLLEPLSFSIRYEGARGWPAFAAGLVLREVGDGRCHYFNFSMAQTLRLYHQGRPVDRDWDGDGMYRSGDGIVFTTAHDLGNPFGDYCLELLRGAFDRAGVISKFPYPPKDGSPADMLFYYGGDDECDPTGVQQIAVRRMRDAGYPYHINIMCDAQRKGYAMTQETFREMLDCGQEPSIHFDYFRIRSPIRQEEFTEQLDLYEKTFGMTPKVFVNHCVMFWGWTDMARWAAERGLKGDNGRFATRLMPDPNPIFSHGFSFGTSHPHFVYDDAAHGDQKLDFLYIPACLYEPRVGEQTYAEDRARLKRILTMGVAGAWFVPMFFHPVYIARCEEAWRALEAAHEIAREEGWRLAEMGVDALCDWWNERSKTEIGQSADGTFAVEAVSPRGVALRLPPEAFGKAFTVDGRETPVARRTVYGRECALAVVPQGRHMCKIG